MAEKGKENGLPDRVAIISDRLEWAERLVLGLSSRVRTGQDWA
jgi:hypothetical protein